jgi:hypothetical protein
MPTGAVRYVVGGLTGGFPEWAVKEVVEKVGEWSFEGGQAKYDNRKVSCTELKFKLWRPKQYYAHETGGPVKEHTELL